MHCNSSVAKLSIWAWMFKTCAPGRTSCKKSQLPCTEQCGPLFVGDISIYKRLVLIGTMTLLALVRRSIPERPNLLIRRTLNHQTWELNPQAMIPVCSVLRRLDWAARALLDVGIPMSFLACHFLCATRAQQVGASSFEFSDSRVEG